jgi:hypothetical protein
MVRLYELLFALEILLAVLALISCLSAYEGELRALPKVVWVIIILLFPLAGFGVPGGRAAAPARPGRRSRVPEEDRCADPPLRRGAAPALGGGSSQTGG